MNRARSLLPTVLNQRYIPRLRHRERRELLLLAAIIAPLLCIWETIFTRRSAAGEIIVNANVEELQNIAVSRAEGQTTSSISQTISDCWQRLNCYSLLNIYRQTVLITQSYVLFSGRGLLDDVQMFTVLDLIGTFHLACVVFCTIGAFWGTSSVPAGTSR